MPPLRAVPPFVMRIRSAYLPGLVRDIRGNTTAYLARLMTYVEKGDLSKGYQDLKRKLGVTAHFSEIIELKFGKKMP